MTHPAAHIPYRDPRGKSSLHRVALWLLLALAFFVLAAAAGAQGLEAPRPSRAHPGRLDLSLLITNAGIRSLDVYSTRRMLAQGNHELFLPDAIAGRTWSMAAYSAGTVALDWWATQQLEKRGHRKLARLVTLIDIGQDAPWAIHNLFLKPKTTTPHEQASIAANKITNPLESTSHSEIDGQRDRGGTVF